MEELNKKYQSNKKTNLNNSANKLPSNKKDSKKYLITSQNIHDKNIKSLVYKSL